MDVKIVQYQLDRFFGSCCNTVVIVVIVGSNPTHCYVSAIGEEGTG